MVENVIGGGSKWSRFVLIVVSGGSGVRCRWLWEWF